MEINDIENKNKRKIDKSKGCTFEMTSNNTELRKNRSKYSKSKNYIGNHRNRKKKRIVRSITWWSLGNAVESLGEGCYFIEK